jgi:dienelactone hydrolase
MTADGSPRRRELYDLLGDLPPRDRPIALPDREESLADGYVVERLTLDLNGVEPVPAIFVRPTGAGPFPAVLYNHAHGGDYARGKEELLISRRSLQPTPYTVDLTRMGFAALAIDHWCFGGRNHASELDTFKLMLWRGQVLWGMMVYDSLRALDYLVSRPDIDSVRITTLGLSMGSTMAWWIAALDERIQLCIDLCCLTDFHTLVARKALHLHGVYYYVPGLLKHFTTAQINGLVAPRPHLCFVATDDPLTPMDGVWRIDEELRSIYSSYSVPGNWQLRAYTGGHHESAEARVEILRWLTGSTQAK